MQACRVAAHSAHPQRACWRAERNLRTLGTSLTSTRGLPQPKQRPPLSHLRGPRAPCAGAWGLRARTPSSSGPRSSGSAGAAWPWPQPPRRCSQTPPARSPDTPGCVQCVLAGRAATQTEGEGGPCLVGAEGSTCRTRASCSRAPACAGLMPTPPTHTTATRQLAARSPHTNTRLARLGGRPGPVEGQ